MYVYIYIYNINNFFNSYGKSFASHIENPLLDAAAFVSFCARSVHNLYTYIYDSFMYIQTNTYVAMCAEGMANSCMLRAA